MTADLTTEALDALINELHESRAGRGLRARAIVAITALRAENERIGNLFDDLCHFPTQDGRADHLMKELAASEARATRAEAKYARLSKELNSMGEANQRQANCINATAASLGPDYAATIEGLPKAAAHVAKLLKDAEAERDAALAGAVKVKPLEWGPVDDDPDAITALDLTICHEVHGYQLYCGGLVIGKEHRNVTDAKAAAWSLHERRILAALQPDPDHLNALLGAAYEAAAEACADYPRAAPDESEWTRYDEQIAHSQACIRALATQPQTDALAKLIREAELRGQVKAGGVFATSGAEERWVQDGENACPACGGSGHKDDAADALAAVRREARAEGMRKAAELIAAEIEVARKFGPMHIPILSGVKKAILAAAEKEAGND